MALDSYIALSARLALRDFKGLKAAFVQDEYRFVNQTHRAIRELGVSLLFTCVPEAEIEKVYPSELLPGVVKINVLTGYNSGVFSLYKTQPYKNRKYDLGYRGRIYPAWHGRAGREKWEIARGVQRHPAARSLKLNISCLEKDRIYGDAWTHYIQSCRAMLGVESGCSVFDFSGEISTKVDLYTELMGLNPECEKDYTFLEETFFHGLEDQIDLNQISPRCLEAAGLRTLLVLYEGSYSNVLEPWRHYVPLRKDFSNFDSVVKVIKDPEAASKIITCAYSEVACADKFSYRKFIQDFDSLIATHSSNSDEEKKPLTDFYINYRFSYVSNPYGLHIERGGNWGKRVIRAAYNKLPLRTQRFLKKLLK